jgi:hypothetical protein
MSAFFRQPGVDLFLTTTANEVSGAVYRLFKASSPEDPSFFEELVWVANDRVALIDILGRRGVPRPLASGIAAVASPVSRLVRGFIGFATPPRSERRDTAITFHREDVDARFDDLWARVSSSPGLRVRRDAAMLRWYLSDPDAAAEPTIVAVADDDGLVGYAVLARHCPATGTAQVRILDLVVRPGGEPAVAALLGGAVAHSRELGVGLVYCPPCGASLAAALHALRPHRLPHPHPLHFMRAAEAAKTAGLASRGVWQATGLDGDTPFCIENHPVSGLRSPG